MNFGNNKNEMFKLCQIGEQTNKQKHVNYLLPMGFVWIQFFYSCLHKFEESAKPPKAILALWNARRSLKK